MKIHVCKAKGCGHGAIIEVDGKIPKAVTSAIIIAPDKILSVYAAKPASITVCPCCGNRIEEAVKVTVKKVEEKKPAENEKPKPWKPPS